jgi:hypothetical protein
MLTSGANASLKPPRNKHKIFHTSDSHFDFFIPVIESPLFKPAPKSESRPPNTTMAAPNNATAANGSNGTTNGTPNGTNGHHKTVWRSTFQRCS